MGSENIMFSIYRKDMVELVSIGNIGYSSIWELRTSGEHLKHTIPVTVANSALKHAQQKVF